MLQHKHLLIHAKVRNPPKDIDMIKNWFLDLIAEIDMKLLMGPIAAYVDIPGNRGLTCAAIIETSHIVLHSWDETDPGLLQLDVYTCGALDPEEVFQAIAVFDPIDVKYKFLDREHGLKELSGAE